MVPRLQNAARMPVNMENGEERRDGFVNAQRRVFGRKNFSRRVQRLCIECGIPMGLKVDGGHGIPTESKSVNNRGSLTVSVEGRRCPHVFGWVARLCQSMGGNL